MDARAIAGLAYLAFIIAIFGGWIANIVKMIGMMPTEVTTEFVLRVVGIPFVPLGAIMGLFV